MAEALQGVYKPRRPQTTSFYQLVEDHGEHLKNVYPDRYERQFGYYRPITEEVFFKYLDCGILRHGFARIRCDQCHYEYLLAFSCKFTLTKVGDTLFLPLLSCQTLCGLF